MYCSSCGGSIKPGLSYCNHCGTRINDEKENGKGKLSEASFNLLVSAIIVIPIVGLGIIMGLLALMKKELGFENEMIFVVVLMSFVMLLASEGALFWLLMNHTKNPKKSADDAQSKNTQLKEVEIKGLNEARTSGISDAIPSVTEHTTRSLDPIPRESKKQ